MACARLNEGPPALGPLGWAPLGCAIFSCFFYRWRLPHSVRSTWGSIDICGVAMCTKMASYTVALLKKFAARPGRKGFSLQRRGGEKFRVAKKMKFRSSARPDLRITPYDMKTSVKTSMKTFVYMVKAARAGGKAFHCKGGGAKKLGSRKK